MSIGARSVALVTGVVAVLGVPLIVSITARADDDVLLSQGHPTLASSTGSAAHSAAQAVDGDPGSRWASAGGPGTQWLRVDLGATRRIDRVKLFWQTSYASAYQVQVSDDGASWTDVYRTRSGRGAVEDLKRLTGKGRYLRVLATERGTEDGYSLREVRVYGPGPAASVVAGPPTVAPAPGLPARTVPNPGARTAAPAVAGLDDPVKKDYALQLVASAENSTLDWRSQYGYVEDLGDGRGYTGGIVGFCSGTSDMLAVVTAYTRREPGNNLAKYLPALRTVDGSDSHAGLDPGFPAAWKAAAADSVFQRVQRNEQDEAYFNPAVSLAKTDGLRALGQFAYYDAAVVHGVDGLRGIRDAARRVTKTPAQGGSETAYLSAFLTARVREMRTEAAHNDTSRVDTAQRVFLAASNLDLNAPLTWKVYGDRYTIAAS
ncbi:MAG: chitosanase [Actinoplanes sp.]|jgi:chitosanase|nr:chitosanase [Actinoplanes sp.]